MRREQDLAAYYDQEAVARVRREVAPERVAWRDRFLTMLRREGRDRVLEVGTGPGRDAQAFVAAGLKVAGIDLSAENVRLAQQVGVEAYQAPVLAMPFPARSFDAGWTMSTLVHVPDTDIEAALAAIADRLVDGAPLAVGLWGGRDYEGLSDRDTIEPPRFFSFRSHERARALLGRLGTLERFETWTPTGRHDLEYQWALVRVARAGTS